MIFGDCATSEFTGHASTITARCIRNQVKMSLPLLMSTCKCSTLTYYLACCREHVTSQTSYNTYHCSTWYCDVSINILCIHIQFQHICIRTILYMYQRQEPAAPEPCCLSLWSRGITSSAPAWCKLSWSGCQRELKPSMREECTNMRQCLYATRWLSSMAKIQLSALSTGCTFPHGKGLLCFSSSK